MFVDFYTDAPMGWHVWRKTKGNKLVGASIRMYNNFYLNAMNMDRRCSRFRFIRKNNSHFL